MATIIQPYNGWREKLAVDVLGGLIGSILQRSNQANQNRKLNALRGVVQEELNAMNAPQQQAAPQITPSDYNSNAWQSAFHSMENPIAQFNAGTADITPSVTPSVNSYPTQADIQGIIAKNLATKRFGMLDPKLVQETLTPYLQAAEAARIEQRKQALADAVLNAPDALGRRNQANAGYINDLLDIAGLNAFQNQYIADRPTPVSFNTGGHIVYGNRDPITGQITLDDNKIPMELTPGQVQQGSQWQQTFDANERQRGVDNAYRQTQADRVYGLQERAQTEAETQGDFARNNSFIYGERGTYKYNPVTGEYDEVKTPDGQPIITRPSNGYGYGRTGSGQISSMVAYWRQRSGDLSRDLREQQKRLADAQLRLGNLPPDSPQYKSANAEVERIKSEIANTQKEIEKIDSYIKGGGAYSGVNSGYSTDDFIAELNTHNQNEKRIKELRDKQTDPQKRKIYDDKLAEIQQRRNEIQGILNPSGQTGQVAPYPPSSSTQKKIAGQI